MTYKLVKFVTLGVLVLLAFLPAPAKNGGDIKNAVVRVEVVSQRPNYNDPWKMNTDRNSSGSGCVVAGERILTNAHIVSDQKFIQVQKAGDVEKYAAEVEFVAHDCDLALLKVKDPEFFKGAVPIQLGGIPAEGDRVTAYGFPSGGSKISVTQGVVSRIELKRYSHSRETMLAVQIDAALNPGNSGGPVLQGDRLAGIAFEVRSDSENTGYIIPVPVIERFFKDIRDGRYDGYPGLKGMFQSVENLALRSALKLKDRRHGVLITMIEYGSTLWNVLNEGDVMLSLDGVPIASDGTIEFVNNDRVDFNYLMCHHQVGDEVELTFLRNGEVLSRRVRLQVEKDLVAPPQYDVQPSYFIFAGLLFMPETWDYLQTWGKDGPPTELAYFLYYSEVEMDRSQVVLLTKVLAHEVNQGYQEMNDVVVLRVNGQAIGSMADLTSAFAKPQGAFHVVELKNGGKIILDAVAAEKAHKEILEKYNIPKDRSDNLK
ncbi:MAG: trypsin-like peptidase domain-containing protein [Thermodesulfovibrionales bacterium]|nr:trypsin-like peptidase domain-containing protein [Thermodesulfovibrionales bacterium]